MITWRRTVETEMKQIVETWHGIQVMSKDRQMWKGYVAALRATRCNWHSMS